MPPESEPTIAPQRPMAFDQLTPVARLWVGYSVAVRAFSPTWEPLNPARKRKAGSMRRIAPRKAQ